MATQGKARGLVPLAGVLFVVLTIVSFSIGGEPPDADASAAEVVEYFDDHEGATAFGAVLEVLGGMALLFFAASLRRAIRRHEDGGGVLSAVAFAGGIVAAAGIGVDAAIRFALGDVATDVEPAAAQTLNALWSNFFFPMVLGMTTLLLATAIAGVLWSVIPKWLAWVTFLVVVAAFTPVGFIAFLVSGVWVLVVSVLLWRRESGELDGGRAPALA